MKEDNQAVIKALNMYGRVPEMWELLEEIERLNTDKEQLTSLVNSCQEEIRKLKSQLQQKENIIKEVREYIEENLCYSTCDGMKYTMPSGKNILEILDKEK